MNKVSIIIPVYKDWETLKICIDSIKHSIDCDMLPVGTKVILVNDYSPIWEDMEKNILQEIKDYSAFEYHCNEENIGFVKTCNKAVFEYCEKENDILLLNSDTKITDGFLIEMKEILDSDDKIAVVCPRSNQAGLYSMPFNDEVRKNYSVDECFDLYQHIKAYLPKTHETMTGVGFCMLIKRTIIEKFGLFDEIYDMGYNEENDFCMRIKSHGYKIMAANHAFVYHYEGKSFESERNTRNEKNLKILLKRYPNYWKLANKYWIMDVNPIDKYAHEIKEHNYDEAFIQQIVDDWNNTIKKRKDELKRANRSGSVIRRIIAKLKRI